MKFFQKTERNFSVNADFAKYLITKIIEKNKNPSTLKQFLSENTILKTIALIYTEKISNFSHNNNNPLFVFIYDVFLNKYGLKKICETKYTQV